MKSLDDSKPSKYITQLDENNFYGWAMSQYLPYNRFKRLKQKEIDGFDANLIGENSACDYLLEIDLEHPNELRRQDNDYAIVTKKLEISRDMLSKHCIDVADQYGIKVDGVQSMKLRQMMFIKILILVIILKI